MGEPALWGNPPPTRAIMGLLRGGGNRPMGEPAGGNRPQRGILGAIERWGKPPYGGNRPQRGILGAIERLPCYL
jgi:hypothetical protein